MRIADNCAVWNDAVITFIITTFAPQIAAV